MNVEYTFDGTMTTYSNIDHAVYEAAEHHGANQLLELEITELRFKGDKALPSVLHLVNWRSHDDWNLVDGGAA